MSDDPVEPRTQEPRAVRDFEDLISIVEMIGIQPFEVSARRREIAEDSESTTAASRPGELLTQVQEQHDDTHLRTRFKIALATGDGEYVVDYALVYSLPGPVEIPDEVMAEFIGKVPAMTFWPFVREAVATMAARMQLEVPVLGLMRAGTVEYQQSPAPEVRPAGAID